MFLTVQFSYDELSYVAVLSLPADNRKTEVKEDGVSVDIKLPIKHVLSRELQVLLMVLFCFLCACLEDNTSNVYLALGCSFTLRKLLS